MEMARDLRAFVAAGALLVTISGAAPVLAQKSGGVLKIYHRDSPASMSILEEATNSTEIPMMGVFNNLALYKQDVPQNSLQSIVPDLATDWSWNEDGTELTWLLTSRNSGTVTCRVPYRWTIKRDLRS
jgi:peptide/nickel transport system substrate-binding protein